jgi:hypothetical protein
VRYTMMTDIYTFGDDLIRSRDLDPVYCALYGAQLSEAQLGRLLLAYLALYHIGFAAWLSEHEGEQYWSGYARSRQERNAIAAGRSLAAGQRAATFSRCKVYRRSKLAAGQISDPRGTDTFTAKL